MILKDMYVIVSVFWEIPLLETLVWNISYPSFLSVR